ncbi:MAG: GNAT family N-acetyltransferase [Oligoflexus sp.]|nr:GNAT family N-acetyltransferase [Oligoflexus sp.]
MPNKQGFASTSGNQKIFRRARPDDVVIVSDLMIASAPDLNPAIFHSYLKPLVSEGFRQNRGIWAAKRAYVVEVDQRVVAVITAYAVRHAPRIFLESLLVIFRQTPFPKALGILWRSLKFGRLYRPLRSKYCYVANLATDADFRGQGVASHLFQEMMKAETTDDIQGFLLDVATENLGAKRVYERLGFVPTSQTKPIDSISGLIRMEKKIESR